MRELVGAYDRRIVIEIIIEQSDRPVLRSPMQWTPLICRLRAGLTLGSRTNTDRMREGHLFLGQPFQPPPTPSPSSSNPAYYRATRRLLSDLSFGQ